jgi:hypothetical protein
MIELPLLLLLVQFGCVAAWPSEYEGFYLCAVNVPKNGWQASVIDG